ncbi:MAG: hypothetical protein LBO74_12825 [Candidatus Symbiothrix sp.]|jgi:phosphate transport system protein|nr:hypothetical protein [Candidatus Symbiothrix sp.]
MNDTIKKLQYEQLNKDFEFISTTVLYQFALIEELLENGWQETTYEQLILNEDKIDALETTLLEKIPSLLMLFAPRAAELRKTIAYQEIILELEHIGDFLMDIAEHLKKTDLKSSDYTGFKSTLKKILAQLKKTVNTAIFSFFRDDKMQAYQTIEKEHNIEILSREITENLVTAFLEIPLTGQDLLNIINLNTITYSLEKIRQDAISIAKSTIFVTEGIDIKHQRPTG